MNGAAGPEPPRPALLGLLGALAFFILLSYALSRPAAESLFLATYTARRLPLGWLAVTLCAALAVTLYQRAAARLPLVALLLVSTALSAAALGALLLAPAAPLLLYVWKDVYVVILLEIFWSLANVLCTSAAARRSYGWFCAAGSIGGILGNVGSGALAQRLGSAGALWLVLPALGAVFLCGLALRGCAPGGPRQGPATSVALREPAPPGALTLLRRSDYLGPLLVLMALVQLVITLVDFQASAALERAYPATDARTAIIGRLYAAVDLLSILLQVLTGPLLRLLGVGGVLLGVPALLSAGLLAALVAPRVATLVLCKVASKAMDYSLFRAAKELLYLPLSYAEKTRGKALIDMLVYRMAKGGASLLLLLLGGLAGGRGLTALTLLLAGAWALLTAVILPRYRRRAAG